MVKRIVSMLVMLLLIGCLSMNAFAAHPVPDLSQNGSLTFRLDMDGVDLNGGWLNLYKVGEITEDDGNYFFTLIDDREITQEEEVDPFLPEEMLTLANALELDSILAPIEAGKAVFEDLKPGLYVVWQTDADATKGFAPIQPFLISVPRFQKDQYVLDVVADPKVALETVPPTTKPPATPDETLPQTGQLNWPVPVLAMGGAALLILGFVLRTAEKKER